ncbi:MAG: nucleotide exchange factor GrpE [Verrucomicrobiota bacterium]
MNETEESESIDETTVTDQDAAEFNGAQEESVADDTLEPGETADLDNEPEEELDPAAQLVADLAKWKDLALRSQADLDNYRKRMAREKIDALKFANSELIQDLFPVLDNFKLGLDAARADSEDSTIFKGMEMILKQFDDFLAAHGVTEVAGEGAAFDPNLHEAVAHIHDDGVPEGHIVEVQRKGYQLHDRLLRAPNVVVSKGPNS